VSGEIPNLNVEILVQLSNLTASVQEATAGLNKIGDSAKLQETKFSSLKSTMGGVFAGNLLTQGLGGLEEGLKGVIEAASQAQTTTVALATAMNNAKVNTEANRGAVEKSVASMENLAFTGNDARGAMMTLVTATGSVSKSTQLMSEAANLARAQHESLGAASETLARALTGKLGGAFKEYGITLDTTLPKNEAITKALNDLNEKIKNQASAYLETYAGKMELLKTKMDNAKETIGGALIPILTNLTSVFAGVLDVIKPILPELTILAATIGAVIVAVKAWEMAQKALDIVLDANPIMLAVAAVIALIAVIVTAWNHSKTFRDIVVDVMKAVVEAIGWVIGALGELVTSFIKIESGPLKLFLGALSHLPFVGGGAKEALKMINEGTQDVGNFFDSAKEKIDGFAKGLDSLKNQKISIGMSTPDLSKGGTGAASVVDVAGQAANGDTVKGAAASAKATAAALTKRNAEIKKYNDEAVKLEDQMNTVLADRQAKMDAATATHNDAINKAQENFNSTQNDLLTKLNDSLTAAQDNYNTAVENATTTHEQNLLDIQQQYADKATQLQQTAADNRQNIIEQSIAVMTNAFANATKIDIGKLFTAGGGSASGLVSQLKDQLAAVVKLQKDAGELAAAGYNQSFINEVIAQGPAQGDALAQSVLTATPATQDSIKSLYASVQDASQNGLNSLAAQMNDGTNFATQALAQQYAQVGVTLQKQLAANSSAMATAIEKENDNFEKALTTAQNALNKATDAANAAYSAGLGKAQETLTKALTTAQDAFDKSVKTISDNTMKQLDALQTKLESVAVSLGSLGASTASISSYSASVGLPSKFTSSGNNPLGAPKDVSNYTNYNVSVTGYNLTDPNATAQQTVAALKFGTPIAANVSAPNAISGNSARAS
jgi:sugar-specific transcriptional regulator TrmB